jgi:hypothetical protein
VRSNVRDLRQSKTERFGHQSGRSCHATGAAGRNPIYFRLASGNCTGTCGEVLITRVLPSE